MDRFSQLEAFVASATLGSFSAVARAEGVTPALIARRVDALEARLGVRLFVRSTRKLALTSEGHALFAQAQEILRSLQETETRIGQGSAKPVGLLRITAPAGFGRRHVAPLMPALCEQHPGLEVSLDLSDDFVDLANDRFDCAIRIGELSDSSLIGIRLAENQRVVVASPAYLKTHGVPKHPAELSAHQCLPLSARSGQTRGWLFQVDGQAVWHSIEGQMACSDGSVLHQWCLDGHGLAWRSLWEVSHDIATGRLISVLDQYRAAPNGIFALMPQRRLTPLRVKVLVEWLKYHYGQSGYFD
ncbi:LysR family transcriptional regulator [Orrella daihaiensis]|uniref:LysR family transcriptional regulator n=1 Tax=Orrella daihaiensis TaxID=2782176 RepID=A0ABY4AQ88_9BURK|nr:LysR family transcriptional regulator [Orrella daihaiensis]UOD51220.1 LysR family transcriptional regulator [Orrella daihaiensis]